MTSRSVMNSVTFLRHESVKWKIAGFIACGDGFLPGVCLERDR